jgi:hypothetical protein
MEIGQNIEEVCLKDKQTHKYSFPKPQKKNTNNKIKRN